MTLSDYIAILHDGTHTLVVDHGDEVFTYDGRGVSDLYDVYHNQPELLRGAYVADKVVGKGAAALMCLSGVRRVYAGVISSAALTMLQGCGVAVSFGEEVPYIINRSASGMCPLEMRCRDCNTPQECLPQINMFVEQMRTQAKYRNNM